MSAVDESVAVQDAHRIERRDGMLVEWDAPIVMDDGVVLRADVFRSVGSGPFPVIMSYGPYAKGLSFQEGYPSAWQQMIAAFPEVARGSSGRYQNWEVIDPEPWVPDGYACVRVDGRGAGRSPGRLEPWSPRESRDFYACIELAALCCDLGEDVRSLPLWDEFYRQRSAQWERINVPLLTAANWGGNGLHLRGNVNGFVRAASSQKWLEIHGREHWTEFYTDYGVGLQKRFFDHFLKGEANGWDTEPPVRLWVRHHDRFEPRSEREWPLARTEWRTLFLDCDDLTLRPEQPQAKSAHSYAGFSDGVTFLLPVEAEDVEITGPLAAKLFVSSETVDADLFLIIRLFSPDLREVVFQGALDPHTPIAQGWLRASHRKLDPKQSSFYQPYHPHDEIQPLEPGLIYELDVEIWPTSIAVPAGYRLALTVRGK